jgi:hypothetical protein
MQHFIKTQYRNFYIFDCKFDTTLVYMHYDIHLIASYTNETLLVTSLPHRQVPMERSAAVFPRLVYSLCWILSAVSCTFTRKELGGGSLTTRDSHDHVVLYEIEILGTSQQPYCRAWHPKHNLAKLNKTFIMWE